ncbi:hypothetical protein PSEUDO8AS_60012 [Pseudomonas sp. 8AS]|uniref:hypothetical protein n=1 Tax=Pseudomonas sp. 8AS TaxID=2653163 RepID=UPI0012F35227|nr:hypothetical protein [Pseudomonas sp. 8AS]VXC19152.1 hypothetical protein PSEUDO8AS_60012 [Pseudomonas sp. 8AS]
MLEDFAIKSMAIIGQGSDPNLEINIQGASKILLTGKAQICQWTTLHASAK